MNPAERIPLSHKIILNLIPAGAKVLDLGCGTGELLQALNAKGAKGRGVEIEENSIIECIRKGLSVFQGNIEEGLKEYPDQSYDWVILNETLQSVFHTELLLKEALRVGKRAIVGIPNFAHWRIRIILALTGRLPVTEVYGYEWYNTPNIRLTTLKDFRNICSHLAIRITEEYPLGHNKMLAGLRKIQPNLFAAHGLFVVEKQP